ncbi:hypothetical protein KM1_168470 [Entamoeba histolytica HM-3:IMSS]|uniref:Transmembrane protein n=2 Tax=Entamoeba histolytica TaxID=5759 RepID=M2Q3X6_ENTHI|nr:Hypothetical protein EHI5A_094990 [Entamoeba histolytica KU27]EMS11244.1 hypothetical protein KM1_168470 [Entamoeba histolytica HM-3:IMSS]
MIPVSPKQSDESQSTQFLYSPIYQNQPVSPFNGLSPNYGGYQSSPVQIVYVSEPQAKLLFVLGFIFCCLWPINACLYRHSTNKQIQQWVQLSILCFFLSLILFSLVIIFVVIGINYELFASLN